MYLIDTNVWLERLLDQERSAEVGRFLESTPSDQLYMTDFTFHSIGVVMHRLNHFDELRRFVKDTFVDGAVGLVHLEPEDTEQILHTCKRFTLDFDDAYQYVAAEKLNLTIVSLDGDFDRTERRRKSPVEVAQ